MAGFLKRWPLCNELDAGGDGGGGQGGGLDIDAASDKIGMDLGFGPKEPQNDGDGGTGDVVSSDPAGTPAAPAPTPAPSPAPAPAPTPAPTAAPAPTPAPAPGAAPAPAAPPRFTAEAAPATWTRAASEQWAVLPLAVREEIARRESDMFRGLEQYKDDARGFKEVRQALGPLEGQLRTQGVGPQEFVRQMANAHLTLANQAIPVAQRTEIARQLMSNYGIDFKEAAAGQPGGTPAYEDPEVKALREKVEGLESKHSEAERLKADGERAQRAKAIEDFAKDPANPYFYDVADEIAVLIRGSGGQMSLKDAYERAVRVNPVTWAKEQERIASEASTKALQEAKERADAARRANAGKLRTSGHQGSGTAASGSMDDTMKETIAKIKARGSK